MNAAITIEDLLGSEGWDDAVHPSRVAAETELLLGEAMQILLLDMRARGHCAGRHQAGNDALQSGRAFVDAPRGLNYLSLIQARLVRTYRADPGFEEARVVGPVTHRGRLRDLAAAAITAATASETKTRREEAEAFDERMGRILADMEPRSSFYERHIAETEARLRRHEPDWPTLDSAMTAFDEAQSAGDISAFLPRDATAAAELAPEEETAGLVPFALTRGRAEENAQTALRMPTRGESDEIAFRMDEKLPDDLETKSAVPGLEYGAVVPWGWRPPRRQRGGEPGNRNRLKSGRFTANAKASRTQSRLLRRALRDLGALVKEVIALRSREPRPTLIQESAPPGTAPP